MRNLAPPARACVIGLALAAAGLGIFLVPQAQAPQDGRLVLALTALAGIMGFWEVKLASEDSVSLDLSAVFAAVLVFDPGVAMVMAAVGASIAGTALRRSLYKVLINSVIYALAAGCGGLVLPGVGEAGLAHAFEPAHLAPILAAASAMFLVNWLSVQTVFVLAGAYPWSSLWRGFDKATAIGYSLEAGLGLLIAVLATGAPWAIAFLAIPAYAAYALVERQVRSKRRTKEMLMRTEAMLAEAQRIAHVGSWELQTEGIEMLWSDETYRILGHEPQGCLPTRQEYLNHAHPRIESA